jgi:site-specific DNA-methyltransferase (adenine-specific)
MKDYRYSWIWEKDSPNGFLNANYAPLKITEDICVFSPYGKVGSLSKVPITYHPQGVRVVNRTKRNNPNSTYRASQGYSVGGNKLNSDAEYVQRYEGYPNNILRFPRDKGAIHPTQKPVDLIRYLIRTYSETGGVILDSCMGSGTTAVAARMEGRHYIGFELSEEYYNKAIQRIKSINL